MRTIGRFAIIDFASFRVFGRRFLAKSNWRFPRICSCDSLRLSRSSKGMQMRPKERQETGEQDLFRSRLDQIIDMEHAR
jgi:hypothetical protein